jgi:Fe2+ or Zn2+ uptake regulation protein
MDRQPLNDRRLPKNYALVLDIVRTGGRGTHRTASDIYSIARERQRNVGVATVHRGLSRLFEAK